MSEESLEIRLARLEERVNGRLHHLETVANDHQDTLYGKDNKGGLCSDFKDLRTENRYLRFLYILLTALALPIINSIIAKFGYGPIKVGG